ncbi:hypothetical protein AMJ87_04785 [candidate division WOR_3 bacterium SM23_60]|uniref:CBM-cenC domain-containing protein n=1 Tax=candidate division WOR_3 bacterium SM23_60 TaxID=1703780 RepID=A0A0S8GJH2_UNCW3|nr:MAG: hypothetical protein AMJ87_04785 [candidate division WOR_3 bacterium SM23_60]
MSRYVALLLLVAFGSASVLITNGEFEEELSTGWSQLMSGAGVMQITRNTTYDPDPDYEVFVHKGDGTGSSTLHQITPIPTTDLEFSVNAKFYVFGTSSQCWSGAAVSISYLDPSDSLLGWTRICARTAACPWVNNNSCHVIQAADTAWHNYAFNIADELTYLPGINGANIAKIEVSLIAQCVDD